VDGTGILDFTCFGEVFFSATQLEVRRRLTKTNERGMYLFINRKFKNNILTPIFCREKCGFLPEDKEKK